MSAPASDRGRWARAVAFSLVLASTAPAARSQQLTYLWGTVVDAAGHAVAAARLHAVSSNDDVTALASSDGTFTIAVPPGDFTIDAAKDGLFADAEITVPSAGARVRLQLRPLKTIAQRTVARTSQATRSGTDLTLSATEIADLPSGKSFAGLLTQLPSAAHGSNGQIHINGDHNGIDYIIDGVPLSANLNRVLGSVIQPADIGYMDVIEGAYPAQYGNRFGAVLNVGTRLYSGPSQLTLDTYGGSYGTASTTLGYHGTFSGGGFFSFTGDFGRTDRALDPPQQSNLHDAGSNADQFLRVSVPSGKDTLDIDLLHSRQTFQIPPDLSQGMPPSTDDDEYQHDLLATMQYRHDIGGHGSLSFGPSYHYARLLDTNDLANDLAAGATPCTDFTDCNGFSVHADRASRDYGFNADYDLRSAKHTVAAGMLYDSTVLAKTYTIALQPGNALSPGGGTFTTTDSAPNVAHQQEAYLQDSWHMGSLYELDYGLRADAFQIFSSDFDRGFSQLSPRLKLTRMLGTAASVYAYYGRLFEPFSFESVSPATAASLYVAANNPGYAFDLRPERDSLYEVGGHVQAGATSIGLRVSRRVAADWIDDTQVGATNVHQDINFPQGRVDLQSLSVQHALSGGQAYLTLTHSLAVNSANCETQLLQNCSLGGPPGGPLVQADHDQRWDAAAGVLLNDDRGGWVSADAEYGSGLSTAAATCNAVYTISCKVPPHLVFDVEKGMAIGPRVSLGVTIRNLLDDRYALTLDNTLQGTHEAQPRSVLLELRTRS